MPTYLANPKSEHFKSSRIRMAALESENLKFIHRMKITYSSPTSPEVSVKGIGLSDLSHFLNTFVFISHSFPCLFVNGEDYISFSWYLMCLIQHPVKNIHT